MNISPVSFINTNFYSNSYKIRSINYQPGNYKYISDVRGCDSVTFTSGAPKSEVLKILLAYGIPDMYSDIILLDSQVLKDFMQRRLFLKPIRSIYKALIPYENSLFPVEKQVYKIIKRESKRTPKAKLDELLHKLVPQHNKRLLAIQQPIFDRLTELSKGMPENLKAEYDNLLAVTNQKLSNTPVVIPFSLKEFKYKLGKIQERIDQTGKGNEFYAMQKIKRIVNTVPVYSKESRQRPDFPKRRYERRLKTMITEASEYAEKSCLYKNKDLISLFSTARSQVNGIPTNIRFNRKSFIYDLQKITNKLQDKKLAHKMVKTAVSLPTSKENLSAFIMKAAERSSEQIGYDLLGGSVGTADHLIPAIKGGDNNISNYGLASAYMNSKRAHTDFKLLLQMNPMIYVYCQRQVDRLIELANNGIFSKIGLSKSYIKIFANKLCKLSPKGTPLIIDTNKLK